MSKPTCEYCFKELKTKQAVNTHYDSCSILAISRMSPSRVSNVISYLSQFQRNFTLQLEDFDEAHETLNNLICNRATGICYHIVEGKAVGVISKKIPYIKSLKEHEITILNRSNIPHTSVIPMDVFQLQVENLMNIS